MKIFIWIVAMIVLVPWSGAVWLSYALVDISGDWVSGNADLLAAEPQVVETVSWLGRTLAGVGETVIIVIWSLGVLSISVIAWGLCRLVDYNRRTTSLQWHPDDPRATAQRIP
ncbi:hypothetical protein [Emcibacter sp. SYSU 3D8]|uniref:hypothetical protein n=1 Tax=Emcibacter sp. SYSU 3D8 TaxID=3133969 RepID=UPI0031FEEFC7